MSDNKDHLMRLTDTDVALMLVGHRAYLKGDPKGKKGDFSFKNLSEIQLTNLSFAGISFNGANLAKSRFSKCDMVGCEFFGADLENADFTRSNLSGADFRGANLNHAILSNTNLRGADFSVASIEGYGKSSSLIEAKIDCAILCQANLTGCDMSGADLAEADLSGADLSLTVLLGADLEGATLNEVKLNNTVLEISRLSNQQTSQLGSRAGIVGAAYSVMPETHIQEMVKDHSLWLESGGKQGNRLDLDGVDLSGFKPNVKVLSASRFRQCNLSGADFGGLNIDMVDFSYSSLEGANLQGVSAQGTNFRSANLSNANLRSGKFCPMPLARRHAWPANFDHTILHGADLTQASFSHAVMIKADLRDCVLTETDFMGVNMKTVKREQ